MSEQRKKVLVMDDEEIVADIAQQMLVYLGYDAIAAATGEETITLYREAFERQAPFDLVIMDLNIQGGMGGMEAVKHILQIDDQARVIVSSGYSNDPIMEDYARFGFRGCIAKPFDLKGLQDAIETVLP